MSFRGLAKRGFARKGGVGSSAGTPAGVRADIGGTFTAADEHSSALYGGVTGWAAGREAPPRGGRAPKEQGGGERAAGARESKDYSRSSARWRRRAWLPLNTLMSESTSMPSTVVAPYCQMS